MEEGNFCPIDMHVTSVIDKINEERMLNPKEDHESEGQFDDYSDDNSWPMSTAVILKIQYENY